MSERKLLWCDLETTGLESKKDRILSVGFIVTDNALNELATFEHDVLTPKENPWNWAKAVREMHAKSGLDKRIEKADFTLDEIRILARAFILQHAGVNPTLAGSSIHFDHRFLLENAPELPALCHYRMLDVSVFKVIGEMLGLKDWANPLGGESKHTPLADIRDSIAAFKWYREHTIFGTKFSGDSETVGPQRVTVV